MEVIMKPTMTGFLDLRQTISLEDQLQLADRLGIKTIALRYDHSKPLVEVSQTRFTVFAKALKAMKMKVSIIDPMIESTYLEDAKAAQINLKTLEYVLSLSDVVKAPYVLLPLPHHEDVIKEFQAIRAWLNPLIMTASRHGRKVVLKPMGPMKANSYAYVMKQMGSAIEGVLYDPVHLTLNKESTTTAYRLLRNHVVAVMTLDSTVTGHPRLLGYGQTDVLTIFKKMIRDKYQGLLVLETRFDLQDAKDTDPQKPFFKRLFSSEKKKKASVKAALSHIIFQDQTHQNVTDEDILANQVRALNTVFMK
jgi:sugar phosphate isomerase/epimerase